MAPRRKTRWIRFSLASLLVLVTACSLWLGRATYLARRQGKTVTEITTAEGIVIFENESRSGAANATASQPSWRELLQERIGMDYFRTVSAVEFATNLGRRKGTQQPKVTDGSLTLLSGVPEVENLELSHNETVTDESLVYLSELRNLTTIYLYHTQVHGHGLVQLLALPNLRHLELSHTPLENIGLQYIGRMTGLKSLRIAHTKVTDEGVAQLAGLTNLEALSLKYTDITDKSLAHLQRLSNLKELILKGTQISADGVQSISEALPKCNVVASYRLGRTPTDVELISDDRQLSADEINDRFKKFDID